MLIETLECLERAKEIVLDAKGEDVAALDVRNISGVTDYYLIVTGNNIPHIKALAESVDVGLKKAGMRCFRVSGTPESEWIAMDYFDMVVHIFSSERRSYYDLEQLWSDAPAIAES